jgi:o-succinylbenzoate synthase
MNISFQPYSLHLKQPLITGNGKFSLRSGWIVRSYMREKCFYSEIAPLPGFSKESQQDVFQWISKNDIHIKKNLNNLDWIHEIPFASIRFGLDAIRLQLLAAADGKSLHHYLNENALNQVKINGLISLLDPIQADAQLEKFIQSGINHVKVKVGIKPSQELNLIRILRKKYPQLIWRIDANQAFSAEDAVHFLNDLKNEPIDYCEQPVDFSNTEALKFVKDNSVIAIAADESAYSLDNILHLIEQDAADVFVIKPMLIGSIQEIQAITDLIKQRGKKLVFTSSLETVVGRRITAQIAAAFTQDPEIPNGLSTGYLFDSDLDYFTEKIENGFFYLNQD